LTGTFGTATISGDAVIQDRRSKVASTRAGLGRYRAQLVEELAQQKPENIPSLCKRGSYHALYSAHWLQLTLGCLPAVTTSKQRPELRPFFVSAGTQLRALLFGVGVLLVLYLPWRIVVPFLPALCWAFALALIGDPIYAWLDGDSCRLVRG
jgi:hypothetical protein